MGSSCCYSCLKAMVFIVNLMVMFVGIVVTGLAVWLLVSEHLYLSSSWEDFSLVTCAVLSVGLLISLLAFLACCGAITHSKCLLGMFVISLLGLMIGEVSVAVLVYFKVSMSKLDFHVSWSTSNIYKISHRLCSHFGMFWLTM